MRDAFCSDPFFGNLHSNKNKYNLQMAIGNIFHAFQPKDKIFFVLFEKVTENLVAMSNDFNNGIKDFDLNDDSMLKLMSDYEHKNDELTHEIFVELGKNFITPFDREDIHALASAIDDIADFIHGSASRMMLYKVNEMTPPIKKLAELILQGCHDVHKAVGELKNLKNIRLITDSCVRINSMENQLG